MRQMERYAEDIQSKHALFLFDSCFSGALFALSRAVPDAITYKTARHVRQFITSGSADEQVPNQSIFRRQFVEALDGEADLNKDGYVTGTELGEFLQDKVINYSRNIQHPQYGKLRNPNLDKGDFVFALPKPPQPPPVVAIAKTTPTPAPVVTATPTPALTFRESDIQKILPSPSLPAMPARPEPGTVVRTRSGIELVYVPPGEFMMGSENGDANERPVHRVTIREGFYMGKYEVTQAQWQAVMGNNPSNFKGDNLPVEQVSWDDAQRFVQKLNAMNDGFEYRLPSEAEWEYACRAGTTTEFAFGSSLSSEQANFDGNYPYGSAQKGVYRQKTTPVGSFQPNAFGLYDMHGNVSEWCEDVYHKNYNGALTDGSAWLRGGESRRRVLRGAAWRFTAVGLRSAIRYRIEPVWRYYGIGFRVVAVARQ